MNIRLSKTLVAACAAAAALAATHTSFAAADLGRRLGTGLVEVSLTGHPLAAPYAATRAVKTTSTAPGFCGPEGCQGAPQRLDVAAADLGKPPFDRGYAPLPHRASLPGNGLEPTDTAPALEDSARQINPGGRGDESEVPEPGTYALMAAGLVAIAYLSRRRLGRY